MNDRLATLRDLGQRLEKCEGLGRNYALEMKIDEAFPDLPHEAYFFLTRVDAAIAFTEAVLPKGSWEVASDGVVMVYPDGGFDFPAETVQRDKDRLALSLCEATIRALIAIEEAAQHDPLDAPHI